MVVSQLAQSLQPRARTVFCSKRFSHLYNYVTELERRSLLRNSYPSKVLTAFESQLKQLPPVMYAGFDPTADSLHIGNLLILVNLFRGAKFGVQPIALIGGATACIGDPSGRSTARARIPREIIAKNSESIADQVRRIAENCLRGTGKEAIFVNNEEWHRKVDSIDYVSCEIETMLHSAVERMAAIKSRMEGDDGIELKEFLYPTFQALDWRHLGKHYKCFFQLGGSDQLGHLDFGAHFIKRSRNAFAAGACLPLITDNAGNKLGKSVGGGVWLSAEKTSPFHFYQFFRQLHDTEAEAMLMKYSLKPFDEVNAILENHRNALGKWVAQDALAQELTSLVHGEEGLETAQRCTRAIFQGSMDDIRRLSRDDLLSLFSGALELKISEISTMGDFADRTRTDQQKGHILMTKGAFKVNGEKITDPAQKFDIAQVAVPNAADLTFIGWGKRKFQLVRWIS